MLSQKSNLALRIEEALEQDERTDNSQIEALDNNGVIILTGVALNNEARMAAAELAESFPGVLSVTNDLEVRSINDPNDNGNDNGNNGRVVPIIPVPLGHRR